MLSNDVALKAAIGPVHCSRRDQPKARNQGAMLRDVLDGPDKVGESRVKLAHDRYRTVRRVLAVERAPKMAPISPRGFARKSAVLSIRSARTVFRYFWTWETRRTCAWRH